MNSPLELYKALDVYTDLSVLEMAHNALFNYKFDVIH